MTISEALKLGSESDILLSHVLGKDKAWIFANQEIKLAAKQSGTLIKLLEKQARGWPIAYLKGQKEFYGLEFIVNPDVLIPRPETEQLVELALRAIGDKRSTIRNVIDVGTGSGNIIISIAKHLSHSVIARSAATKQSQGDRHGLRPRDDIMLYAIDASAKALQIAKHNAKRHAVADKIKFLRGNLLEPMMSDNRLAINDSIILANLPYLTTKQLSNETIKREPRLALDAGPDGLKYYRELFEQFVSMLSLRGATLRSNPKEIAALPSVARNDNTILLLEHGPAQKAPLIKLAKKYFASAKITATKDLAKRWRVLEIKI